MYTCMLSHFCCVRLFAILWTIAWTIAWTVRLLCPWDSPGKNTGVGCLALLLGNLPDPGIKPSSLISPALAGRFWTTVPPG